MTTPSTASDAMKSIGIVQEGTSVLTEPTRPFELPREATEAREIVAALHAAAHRAATVHTFSKGMGVAAPQIGVGRRVAIVRPADGDAIALLNPVVVEESSDTDEQFEGCLSFFDVRGKVPRPRTLRVRHQDFDGTCQTTIFTDSPGWSHTKSITWTGCCMSRGWFPAAARSRWPSTRARDRTGGIARAPGHRSKQPWQRQAGHLRVPQILSAVVDVQVNVSGSGRSASS